MFQFYVGAGGSRAVGPRRVRFVTEEHRERGPEVEPSASRKSAQALAADLGADARSRLRTGDAGACAAVSRNTLGVLEAEVAAQRAAGAKIACEAGCAFCCHQRVGVFAHEAAALLRELRNRLSPADAEAIERQILANARTIDGWTPERHRAANLRCALLVEGRCAAYEARPSACARYHSLSRARCEYSYEHPEDIGTPRNSRPALAALQDLGNAVESSLEAALVDAGLPAAKGELHQTLRALLENPTAAAGLRPSSAP
jgi:hypothetical protein